MSQHDDMVDAAAFAFQSVPQKPKVRGWLLLLAILHSIVYPLFVSLYNLFFIVYLFTTPELFDPEHATQLAAVLFIIFSLTSIVTTSLVSGVMLWCRAKSALTAAYIAIFTSLGFFSLLFFVDKGSTWMDFVLSLAYATGTILYFEKSKRIAATFGA